MNPNFMKLLLTSNGFSNQAIAASLFDSVDKKPGDTNLVFRLSKAIYGEEAEQDSMAGLGLVDFYLLPHLNNSHFAARIEANLNNAMKEIKRRTYVLDDQSALTVIDGKVDHIGGGKYLEFN